MVKFKNFKVFTFFVGAFVIGFFYSRLPKFSGSRTSLVVSSGIHWETSLEDSAKLAKQSKKPLLVDFYADWCTYCKEMDKTTYQDPNVVALSNQFVCARVNVDDQQELANRFQIAGLPTLLFIQPSSGKSKRIEGYEQPAQLALAMTQFTTEIPRNHLENRPR